MNDFTMILLDAGLKGLVLLAAATIAVVALRRSSASTRHTLWLLAMLALLALPALSAMLPRWTVLPDVTRWVESAERTETASAVAPADPGEATIDAQPTAPLPAVAAERGVTYSATPAVPPVDDDPGSGYADSAAAARGGVPAERLRV